MALVKIGYTWLSYDDRNPAKGRWDAGFLEHILSGGVWLPPGGLEIEEMAWTPDDGIGRIIIAPVGSYVENGVELQVAAALSRDLAKLEWSVLIATSDECALFPWPKVTLPESCKLWIQTPQPGKPYPIGARFIPFGPPTPPQPRSHPLVEVAPGERVWDVYFQGQVNHERREEMWVALNDLYHASELQVYLDDTGGFAQGSARDVYLNRLGISWIAPAPSGPCTQDSFRLYEALDAGCIPIVDAVRPGDLGRGYWEMIGFQPMAADDWRYLLHLTPPLLERRHFFAARESAKWQQFKRRIVTQLHDDCGRIGALSGDPPSDLVTVIIPTSPVPSNPDLSMIQTTIASVRERLPHAEILITCDGVRPEQEHRRQAYEIFCHELAMWTNTEHNVCPWVFDQHLHQSGMLDRILAEVTTPYLLYVEADCPLEGEIPFDDLLRAMKRDYLNSVRLYHDVAVTEGSEHLFPLLHSTEERVGLEALWTPTLQWSQRPHLAYTNWYRHVIETYFGPESRSFIEDHMHGVVLNGLNRVVTHGRGAVLQPRKHVEEAWQRWRMAVYSPEGSWKRSGHLDGRAGDPKYSVLIAPSEDRPEGGMAPGVYEV